MKFNLYILALLSIVILISCGSPTDPQVLISNAKLKSETKWACDPSSHNKLFKVTYKEYSKEGLLIKSIHFNDKGSMISESDITYQDNKSIEKINIYDNSGNVNSTKLTTSTFDNNGRTISLVESSLNGDILKKQEFSYDSKGNLIKRIDTKADSKPSEIVFTNVYNKDGQIVERIESLDLNGSFSLKESIVYNTNENKIQRITTDNNGLVLSVNTYIFNISGKIVSESVSDPFGNVISYYLFEYKYF